MGRPNNPPGVEYHAPAPEVLVHFARSVGEGLGEDFSGPDIVQGLADFMGVVARVLANDLNRKGNSEVDNRVE